jgi:hypothetical protein
MWFVQELPPVAPALKRVGGICCNDIPLIFPGKFYPRIIVANILMLNVVTLFCA